MSNVTFVDFSQVTNLVANLVEGIDRSNFKPDRIIGVGRGGCLPASMISYYYGVPMTVVDWSGQNRDGRECLAWACEDLAAGKKFIVVDNVISSGDTIKELLEDWASCYNPRSEIDSIIKENVLVAVLQARKSTAFFHEDICKFECGEVVDNDEFFKYPNDSWWE